MINYIAYKLINELKMSNSISKLHLDLRLPHYRNEFNLLFSIATQIYNEAESEPMGLNGLNIAIELELNDLQTLEKEEQVVTRFRFNPTSTLTTFELKLRLKEDSNVICLRRILPKSRLFDKLRIQSAIYLNNSYSLIKRKLY